MFNNLSDKLDKAFHILKGHGKITEVNVAETLKEVRRAFRMWNALSSLSLKLLNIMACCFYELQI